MLVWSGVLSAILAAAMAAAANEPPDIMLAKKWRGQWTVGEFWVSEKLDGVRARWDGQKLISRGGKIFAAPDWFVAGFPPTVMDGELWAGRGRYEETMSIVRRASPHDGWQAARFMVFDLPVHGGVFDERVAAMRALAEKNTSPYWRIVEQREINSNHSLMAWFDAVVAGGGEGLMLHRKSAVYAAKRSDNLLKLKPFDDAEATVIGYRGGKGKYAGQVGSLRVRDTAGREFFIGSGLSDEQRRHPPPVGSVITFRHQGFTGAGIPRFAVFLRVRGEELNGN